MRGMRAIKILLSCGASLALASQAWGLPSPTSLLQARGVNPWRDLDTQVPSQPTPRVTEDRVGPGGYVGPGVGRQWYDWEALYFWRTDTHAYVVLSTGFRILPGVITRDFPVAPSSPDSGIAGVDFTDGGDPVAYAGDLMIDTGGDGTWDYGITMGAYTGATGRAGMTYGDLYLVDQTGGYAGTGAYRSGYTQASPWVGVAQAILTGLNYSAEKIYVTQQAGEDMNRSTDPWARYLAAFEIDLGLFPDFRWMPLTLHWTMECGNDVGDLEIPPPSPPLVPEPAALLLLGAGAALVKRLRRRRT